MKNIIEKILAENKMKYKEILKADSGFTNSVFYVDKNYVVKICNDSKKKKKLDKEIDFYKHSKLPFIAKYLADGQIDDYRYLIISYISGVPLYKIWHKLNFTEREEMVKQLAYILSAFHSQSYHYLPSEIIFLNWGDKWQKSFSLNVTELQKRNFNTQKIEEFANNKLDIIFREQKLGLVHNDTHFDNLLLDGKTLKLIDFDRVLYGSIDYEFLIIKSMIDNPYKFANEEDEKNTKQEDYKDILVLLEKYYPKMFDFEFLEDRIFIYQFIYNLGQGFEYNRNDWVEKEIKNFEKYFNL